MDRVKYEKYIVRNATSGRTFWIINYKFEYQMKNTRSGRNSKNFEEIFVR